MTMAWANRGSVGKGKTENLTRETLLKDLRKIISEIGRSPSLKEYRTNGGAYSSKPFIKVFGSWGGAIQATGGTVQVGGRVMPPLSLPRETYDKFFHIKADKVLIVFDPHIPYHCPDMFNKAIDVARKEQIKIIVIGGDFFDFKSLYTKETQTTRIDWTEEIEEACRVMDVLCLHFDHIYIIKGNHDHRLTRLLGNDERTSRLYRLIFNNPKVHFSKYQFLNINDDWQVIHSGNTKVKLSKLERVVNVTRKSTLVGHSHRWAMAIHDSGREVLCEGLHLTRPELHEYKSLVRDDYSEWIQGFWILKNNKIYPYVNHPLIGDNKETYD